MLSTTGGNWHKFITINLSLYMDPTMAQATVSGTVVCKAGTEPVTLRQITDTYKVAEFSVRDTESFYHKGDDRPGQFYKVQVSSKQAEGLVSRLQRGDFVCVSGQLVQRTWNDKTFLDLKDARVNQPWKDNKPAETPSPDPF